METQTKEQYLRTGYYLIELLRSVLKDTVPEPMPEGVTFEGLYEVAKLHSIDCIAYSGAKKIPGKNLGSFEEKWKKRNMQCATQGIVQLAERERIYQTFSQAGIKILPLKGCLMKDLYPRQEYRQMADLDILIEHKEMEKADKLMESLGFEANGYFGLGHHNEYQKKPWCTVEIHHDLLPERIENASKYKDVWERAYEEKPGSGIYRFTWDDFYIYMLEHFAKHFRSGGSGIRSIMDVYVFLQQKGDRLHPEYLEKRLRDLGLWELKEQAEQISKAWFEEGISKVYEEMEERIILSGTYGKQEQWYDSRLDELKEKYGSERIAFLVYVWKRIFLPYRDIKILCPILQKVPVLYPFVCIWRILKRGFEEPKKIKSEFLYRKKRIEKQSEKTDSSKGIIG